MGRSGIDAGQFSDITCLLLFGSGTTVGKRFLLRRERDVDQGDKYELSRRRRRPEPVAGHVDDLYYADRGAFDAGMRSKSGRRHFTCSCCCLKAR